MLFREPVEDIRRPGSSNAILCDLARLSRREPALNAFIAEVEGYIDGLHRALSRRAA